MEEEDIEIDVETTAVAENREERFQNERAKDLQESQQETSNNNNNQTIQTKGKKRNFQATYPVGIDKPLGERKKVSLKKQRANENRWFGVDNQNAVLVEPPAIFEIKVSQNLDSFLDNLRAFLKQTEVNNNNNGNEATDLNAFFQQVLQHPDLQLVSIDDTNRMLTAGYCSPESIDAVWKQKTRMDSVFDGGHSKVYFRVRDEMFPQEKTSFINRVGDRLLEIHSAINVFENMRDTTFVDLCGAPGAFSQFLLTRAPRPCKGYGISLKTGDEWFPELTNNNAKYKVSNGADDTGNIYSTTNLNALAQLITSDNSRVNLVVADGGFKIPLSSEGKHLENYQEVLTSRIVLSEIVGMMKCLSEHGNFVCKIFDTFSHLTMSLIYVTTLLFRNTYIVKPLHNKLVNSERYLVGKGLVARNLSFQFLHDLLSELHGRCSDTQTPLSVLPIQFFQSDAEFMKTATTMAQTICNKQTEVLKEVMDKVADNVKKEKRKQRFAGL